VCRMHAPLPRTSCRHATADWPNRT
jgi:hypothetical protein